MALNATFIVTSIEIDTARISNPTKTEHTIDFKMAPTTTTNLWLDCLAAESTGAIRFEESKEFYSVRLNDVFEGLEAAHNGDKEWEEWIDEFGPHPIILLLPAAKGKLVPFHHFVQDGGGQQWVGLAGLGGASTPWRSLKTTEMQKSLTSEQLAKEIAKLQLPSLGQFMACASDTLQSTTEKVEAITGDSVRLMGDLANTCAVQAIKAPMLKYLNVKVGTQVKATMVLAAVIMWMDELRMRQNATVPPAWEERFQHLWVIGSGVTNCVKTHPPPEDNDLFDDHSLAVVGFLASYKERISQDDEATEASTPGKKKPRAAPKSSSPKKRSKTDAAASRDRELDERRDDHRDDLGVSGGYRSPPATPTTGRGKEQASTARTPNTLGKGSPDNGSSSSSDGSDRGGRGGRHDNRREDNIREPTPREFDEEDDGTEAQETTSGQPPDRFEAMFQLNATMARAINELAFQGKEQRAEERKKSSLLSSWTLRARTLFRLLSAKNWTERGTPHLNAFVREAIREKKPQRALNLISEEALEAHWPGMASTSGLTELFVRGFAAPDFMETPGGFTVFMFKPREHLEEITDAEKKQRLQDLFGTGDLSEDTLKSFVKKDWFLPKEKSDCEDQLKVCILMMDLLTAENGISGQGYRHGLKLIQDNPVRFAREAKVDKHFYWKFLHLLDTVFQRFCEQLRDYADTEDPLLEASAYGLSTFQANLIDKGMGSFLDLGQTPSLSLPHSLEKHTKKTAKKTAGGSEKVSPGDSLKKTPSKKKEPLKVDPWISNPSPVSKWRIPAGKTFSVLFGRGEYENQSGFPHAKHHISGKLVPQCLGFVTRGDCARGAQCTMAHPDSSKMDPDDYDATDKRFEAVYR
jgi:hypothetical protein